MRRMTAMTAAVLLVVPGVAFGQEWIQYASPTDAFGVNFPSEPRVLDIAYPTEYGITLPGRVYRAESGASHYSVTVVDYASAEAVHTAKAARCKANGGVGDQCQNDWRGDVQGSIVFASWKLMQRNAKVTHYARSVVDQVEGHQVQLLGADGARTFAAIHRHGTRLYILEATVPKGAPAPGLFQQSLEFLSEDGNPIRYRTYYTTGYSEDWKFPSGPPIRTRPSDR